MSQTSTLLPSWVQRLNIVPICDSWFNHGSSSLVWPRRARGGVHVFGSWRGSSTSRPKRPHCRCRRYFPVLGVGGLWGLSKEFLRLYGRGCRSMGGEGPGTVELTGRVPRGVAPAMEVSSAHRGGESLVSFWLDKGRGTSAQWLRGVA